MRTIATILLLTFGISLVIAQPGRNRERIQSARIALITERLALSPEQAEKFWPVYREYEQKRMEVRDRFQEKRKNVNLETASEEDKAELLQAHMAMKQQMLDLEKAYSERFLEVISTEQLFALNRAEEDFRRMILNQLQKRQMHNQRPRRGRW